MNHFGLQLVSFIELVVVGPNVRRLARCAGEVDLIWTGAGASACSAFAVAANDWVRAHLHVKNPTPTCDCCFLEAVAHSTLTLTPTLTPNLTLTLTLCQPARRCCCSTWVR